MKIAVLLTCFNRKQKTLSCLQSLQRQSLQDMQFEVYLTDDKSLDGTYDAVKKEFPEVNIFSGTGSLFWAGGMRYTWNKALNSDAGYYLLINDDTVLATNAIKQLLDCVKSFKEPVICVGSTSDVKSGEISYGGRKLKSATGPKSYIVFSENEVLECDLGNANIMLVPHRIVQEIGILSEDYTHGIADYDYTLKAKRAGFKVIVAPGILGNCTDDHGNNWKSSDMRLSKRIEYLYSPKGLAYKEYLIFIRRFFPKHIAPAIFKLWLKTLFPIIWDKLKNEKRYNPI